MAKKIGLKEFARRRRELMQMMDGNSIAVLPSASLVARNSDTDYQFRQNSDFQYLTGFDEPNSVVALVPGREHGECILFCQERDASLEQWHGNVTGPERAMQLFGIDDAFPISDIDDILPGLIEGKTKLYYSMGSHDEFDEQVIAWVNSIGNNQQSGSKPPGEFVQLDQHLHELRLFKSKQEIQVLRKASEITALGHQRLLEKLAPGVYEYQLEAELLHAFASEGARFPAYPSIVGSGNNACILHYIQNKDQVKKGDLVLVDAGCEYECYASDVTRTLPASGKFSKAQRAVYEIVLKAQDAAINMIQPGNHWNQSHEIAIEIITEGLIDLGLLEGDRDELIASQAYKKFYMHRTGHWLGLDVHDVGEYKIDDEWRILEEGMVVTVEPGIYILEDSENVLSKYRGIGIRIEDDVLVTKTGNEVLTAMIPKSIEDIEANMKKDGARV